MLDTIKTYAIGIAIIFGLSGFSYGIYKGRQLDKLQAEIEIAQVKQQAKNEVKAAVASKITKDTTNEFEKRTRSIDQYYSNTRLPNCSTSSTSQVSSTTPTTDGTPADNQFVSKCARTTQQLVSLQEWLVKELQVFNAD